MYHFSVECPDRRAADQELRDLCFLVLQAETGEPGIKLLRGACRYTWIEDSFKTQQNVSISAQPIQYMYYKYYSKQILHFFIVYKIYPRYQIQLLQT